MNNEKLEIISLLNEKNIWTKQLGLMVYGSVEVRESNGKKYLYVHKRVNGIKRSSYVGEYDEALHLSLVQNNVEANRIKKKLRDIDKKLAQLQYFETPLSEQVRINIDYAKRSMVETIYRQAVLEGIAVTFLDTETIIEGGKINNISADDVQKINNLKHAWQLILDAGVLVSPTNYALLCLINKIVEEGFYYNAGNIRTVPVSIGGTKWKPELPVESIVKEDLNEILLDNEYDIYTKAIKLMLYVMRKQIFIDGNKRTAVIFANHLLVANGAGLIVVPEEAVPEYKKELISYYETNDDKAISAFIAEKCLTKLN